MGADVTQSSPHDHYHAGLVGHYPGALAAWEVERLRRAPVMIAGCDPCAVLAGEGLVRAGAEHLILVDATCHGDGPPLPGGFAHERGMNRAVALAARLRAINPFLRVEVVEDAIGPRTVALIAAAAVVIDGLGSDLAVRRTLLSYARRVRTPVVRRIGRGAAGVRVLDFRLAHRRRDRRTPAFDAGGHGGPWGDLVTAGLTTRACLDLIAGRTPLPSVLIDPSATLCPRGPWPARAVRAAVMRPVAVLERAAGVLVRRVQAAGVRS
jgi:hypothetical protein